MLAPTDADAATLLPTTESSLSPASDSRAATCAARMPLASDDPRPYRRPCAMRLGKKSGTQSKCVEKTTAGRGAIDIFAGR